jgi:hypothetical protein
LSRELQKETNMSANRIVTVVVAAWVVSVMWAPPGLAAQTPQEHEHPAPATTKAAGSSMDAKCQAMMNERERMMADMKAADQRLDALVDAMNAASDTEQVTATAIVVTEMVAQRRAMQAGMMKMQEGMMSHMMEHMQAGGGSMAMCPMMKEMGGMKP